LLCTGLVLAALAGSSGLSQNQAGISVSFDHVQRAPRSDDPDLLWLRMKNSGHNPIQVLATAPEAGAEGVELVHEIVQDSKPLSGWISPPEHYSPVNETTTVEIQPNTDLAFSVPLNHVGPSWLLRITFEVVNPKVRSDRQPQGTVNFTWASVPIKERSAWKK
jgi:hypothetical protein